ncbi:MAG TPA: S49 family peptidase [Gammaproteobacteria bacterium]|nr:S49 family peptidase [Gammaproteobacteria bacterium]
MTDKPENDKTAADSTRKASDPWTDNAVQAEQKHTTDTERPVAKASESTDRQTDDWQRDLLNRLAFSAINEQRRARRWGIFFKSLFVLYLFGILALYYPKTASDLEFGKHATHTALIDISGPIAESATASADNVVSALRRAFKDKNTKAVILRINSPGGSPVQAGYINDEMFRLREANPDIPLYAVVSDMCASAAYYIASGATEIYADKGSIVGSIGVLMDSYGFVGALNKLGVERRLITAGEHKGFLDPFSPLKPGDKAFMEGMLEEVHQQFINVVKKGRGDKLSDNPELFSGLFWSGETSVKLGLVDGLGSASYVAREIVGVEKIVDFTTRPNYLDRFAERIGVSAASAISSLLMTPGALR